MTHAMPQSGTERGVARRVEGIVCMYKKEGNMIFGTFWESLFFGHM